MKWVLGLLTLVLAALALSKTRAAKSPATPVEAYGEAADQARVATKTLSRNVGPTAACRCATVVPAPTRPSAATARRR